jgi:hypothetical protein
VFRNHPFLGENFPHVINKESDNDDDDDDNNSNNKWSALAKEECRRYNDMLCT